MNKRLTMREEDVTIAHTIADRLGTSVDEAVATALRELEQRIRQPVLSAAQQADLDAIRALVEEAQKHRLPGAINDHGYLYDWNGLPA
ncbi:type II toxin-antitoxin system VapB family antitoxin [Methylobacterium sp. Leaf466]|uniref:type II toxin-antitoxin system VapB family antitoxin n=1 Tax=Methylobacterium sp. Leaf466 TaxID=1736386 RepID=UPI0007020475|nr:type II toxin-antitoxin system VapB family antitoxin [Methylobacterium sp. Leaf466]KQT78900.1 hypothetical protein ASG59_06940 [Methylobacterium sp. Leaf466]